MGFYYKRSECPLLSFLFILNICSWAIHAQLDNSNQPEVTIQQGTLQGTTLTIENGRNVSAFLGIPYGQPPVGNLRFANPVAAEGWNGILDATVDPVSCTQLSNGVSTGDEDCLYINVYTPLLPQNTSTSLLPVMVYIYGGAFHLGSAKSTSNGPSYILAEDVVLVTPNYRLGALGFLSTGDEVASGNWGLKDQVLALRWVQDNIEYFGGDPDQVTIFGCSAGSASVHLLTLSNATTGLFHRYITQSGSALSTWAHQPRAEYASRAYKLGNFLGCSNDTSDSLITCLRSVNASDIISVKSQFYVWNTIPDLIWGPTDEPNIEGAIITDTPTNLFAAGNVRDLPWICGIVRDEGLLHTLGLYEDEELFEDFLENIDYILVDLLSLTYQPDSGVTWVSAIKSYYFNDDLTTDRTILLSNLTLLISDALFFYPAYKALQQFLPLAENSQYFYSFEYQGTYSKTYLISNSTKSYGVAHGDDTLYLFPPDSKLSEFDLALSESDLEMVDIMVQLWTSFATNGTPTTSALNGETWEPFSEEDNYLRIGSESDITLESETYFSKERMQFWAALEASSVEPVIEAASEDSGAVDACTNLIIALLLPCSVIILFNMG